MLLFSVTASETPHLIDMKAYPEFVKKLQIEPAVQVQHHGKEKTVVRDIAQIIAVQTELVEEAHKKGWNSLGAKAEGQFKINLLEFGHGVGMSAVGVSRLPYVLGKEIGVGSYVFISRYGLKKFNQKAVIRHLARVADSIQIIFEIENGAEWIPGSTCEIELDSIKTVPFRIPASGLVYISSEEYIIREKTPGVFEPVHVSVIDEDSTSFQVVGDIVVGDRIVGEGAILLKPEVQKFYKYRVEQ